MNSSSESSSYYPVYTGVWTNWSRGRVLGATLTLNRREADLLIAFTAFFIAFVSTRTWRITCFFVHRILSTATDQNSTYHQQQVILRNALNPEEGLPLLWKLFWANRRRREKRFQPLFMGTLAAICIGIFTIAGGYSSQITTALGDEVLVKPKNCRNAISTLYNSLDQLVERSTWFSESLNIAANYAQQCYSSNSTGLVDCKRFTLKRLVSQVEQNAPCPFSSNMCRTGSANLRIDSGYLDSHNHFGLNSPPDQRIIWRNVLHCAPLITDNFTSQINTSSTDLLTLYHYGKLHLTKDLEMDYVATSRSFRSQYSAILSKEEMVTYANLNIQSSTCPVRNGKPDLSTTMFVPADSLARADADIYLLFLSGNGVLFWEPSEDEWYRIIESSNKVLGLSDDEVSDHLYLPLEPASPLGCTDQYQFCNPAYQGGRACGPLASYLDAVAGATPFFNTTHKDDKGSDMGDRWIYFRDTFRVATVPKIIDHLGPRSLLSQVHLTGAIQNHLEPNQCIPTPAALARYVNFTAPAQIELCHNQKMRSTVYASFSLFGLTFTFIIGFLIILYSYTQERLSTWTYKKRGRKAYQHLEWTSNGTLQLHRMAHEEMGWGTWSGCTELIPTTANQDILGRLDITDPSRPGIVASAQRSCARREETNTNDTAASPAQTIQEQEEAITNLEETNPLKRGEGSLKLLLPQATTTTERHSSAVSVVSTISAFSAVSQRETV
ncbi:hypothetical protein F5Y17DRAFT_472956 [Xylariaceae sp. FL0594]|nr:hypothetical protein F5Y17DRAFT_472956 [Xylariaceae sp. FL0594]